VRGQIIKLNVQDNQAVAAGDVLFEIDPADYELSWQKQRLPSQLSTSRSRWRARRTLNSNFRSRPRKRRGAGEGELKQAGDTLQRLQPLLPNGFAESRRRGSSSDGEAGRNRHGRQCRNSS
jgi:multidrug efflux system membrane fusion protein